MNKNILNNIFSINNEIKLSLNDKEYLEELKEAIFDLIEEEGEVGNVKIKEIVLDTLIKENKQNIIKYLGLEIEEDIEDAIKKQLEDPNFLKKEESEPSGDFFTRYLEDDTINDLINSLKGFERKAEGSKEVFIKKRGCKIPTARIDAIGDILKSKFNKIDFLSNKDNEEQAAIILIIYDSIFDIILETPYDMCDTTKTIEIMGMITTKLSNVIGLSDGFRKDLLETVRESYQSKKEARDGGLTTAND